MQVWELEEETEAYGSRCFLHGAFWLGSLAPSGEAVSCMVRPEQNSCACRCGSWRRR